MTTITLGGGLVSWWASGLVAGATVVYSVILTGSHYEQLGDIFEGGDSFYPRHYSSLL